MTYANGLQHIPFAEYQRIPRVNWSTLREMGKSPAHYRAKLLQSIDEDTDAKLIGRATHVATFEPDLFHSKFITWHDGARRGKAWEKFQEEHAGLEILTEGGAATVDALAKSARSSPMAQPYLSGGRRELSVLWTHTVPPQVGLDGYSFEMKGRLDFLANIGAIVDLKTTRDASPEGFGKQVANYEYHVQAAVYVDAVKAVTGEELPFVFVAVEVAPPHIVQVYTMPAEILELGRQRYRDHLGRLNQCRRENDWQGYGAGPLEVTLPRWATPGEDDDVHALDLVINS
jgi:hypothetical protein